MLIRKSQMRRTPSGRDQELFEPICETWRRGDKVPSTGRYQALGVEGDGKSVADPL